MASEPMLASEEAERILAAFPVQVKSETTPLSEAQNRFLALDILSPGDMPEFDKSAMDGYAYISGDDSPSYRVIETIAAGTPPKQTITPGLCARIMTGAMLPPGADRVVMRECTEEADGWMKIIRENPNDNIRRRGEDLHAGEAVMARGDRLTAARIAMLASLGFAHVPTAKPPRVAIITTGSELVPPGAPLGPGKIFDSNSHSLVAQLRDCGCEPILLGEVADHAETTAQAIASGLQRCDAIILSGGVSAGDFDFVPAAMKQAGCTLHFQKIAVQPGMPTVFASRGGQAVFGLPGNPVSTFVIFEVFIKPLMLRWLGHAYRPLILPAVLETDYRRRRSERTLFLPALYRDGKAEILAYHGSAHLHALSRANALLRVPAGLKAIPAGSMVDVRLL